MKKHERWLELRKELYLRTRKQVELRLGRDSADLLNYRRSYEKDFLGAWRIASQSQFLKDLARRDIVLMGDFHSSQQSQKAHLRILKKILQQKQWRRPLTIGIECVDSKFQSIVDDFLGGRIGEESFLKHVQWDKRWGFSWDYYRGLFYFAKKHNISILALNKTYSRRTEQTLKKRDEWASKIIAKYLGNNPGSFLFVIYGDLHISRGHIPKNLKNLGIASDKTISIFQNPETFYFRVMKKTKNKDVDLVRLETGDYCLLSVPPWVQWQNYQLYLELADQQLIQMDYSNLDENDDDDDFDDELDAVDYSDYVARYVEFIAKEFEIRIKLDQLDVSSINDDLVWDKISEAYGGGTFKIIQELVEDGFSLFLPELNLGLLAKASVNHAASLAMQYIYHQLLLGTSPSKKSRATPASRVLDLFPGDFESLIWLLTISYFGVKIINHRLKSDTLLDIKQALMQKNSDADKSVLQLTLAQKMKELLVLSGRPPLKKFPRYHRGIIYYQAADLLAGMLGEKMYNGFVKGSLNLSTMKMLLQKDYSAKDFSVTYYEILEIIDSLPAPFFSKQERL